MTESLSYEFSTAHGPGTALTISLQGYFFPEVRQWLLSVTERSSSIINWT